MINTRRNTMTINKAPALMLAWGLAVLLASLVGQYFELEQDYLLIFWAGLTLLGIAGHSLCYMRGLGKNFSIWMGLIGVGWLFTLFVFKWDNGANIALIADLPAVWLALLGVAYIVTALQIDRRFFYIAGFTFAVALILELSARRIVRIDFINEYAQLIFGLAVSIPLFVASSARYYKPKPKTEPAPVAPQATATPPTATSSG
jgi:hypothetical protein